MVAHGEMVPAEPDCENDSCAVPKNKYEQILRKNSLFALRFWDIEDLVNRATCQIVCCSDKFLVPYQPAIIEIGHQKERRSAEVLCTWIERYGYISSMYRSAPVMQNILTHTKTKLPPLNQ